MGGHRGFHGDGRTEGEEGGGYVLTENITTWRPHWRVNRGQGRRGIFIAGD